jgi:CBS domain containing-hemolysin-like protein
MYVFAEFVPKSLARYYPQRVSLASIRIVSAMSRWATPVVRRFLDLLEKISPAFAEVPVGRLSVYSLEEIREMIQTSSAEGQLPHRSTQMIEGALRLSQIPVSKIMTPFHKVESVNLGMDPEKILDEVAEVGHTRVPVYRVSPRKLAGYLHVKDLLFVWRGALPLKLDALMRNPLQVPPEFVAGQLLEDFRKGLSHLAIVTDAAGDCQGIVTLQDVLEEVVGEILKDASLENFQ